MANPDVTSAETVPAAKEKSVVKSALRTLTVFEVFAQQQAPLTLSELARALGIPISSCHGLIATLQNEGYPCLSALIRPHRNALWISRRYPNVRDASRDAVAWFSQDVA